MGPWFYEIFKIMWYTMLICCIWGVSWPSCGACKGICTPVLVSFGLCWCTLGGGTLAVAGWCTTAAFFREGADFRWLRFCGQVHISWLVFPHAPHFLCFFVGGGPSTCAWQAPLAYASFWGALMVISTFFENQNFGNSTAPFHCHATHLPKYCAIHGHPFAALHISHIYYTM